MPFGALVERNCPQGLDVVANREALALAAYSFGGLRSMNGSRLLKAHFILVDEYAAIVSDLLHQSKGPGLDPLGTSPPAK
ncbi:MAG: hypothetical protein V1792_21625 [Pseudomonadota bacterium]